MPIEILLFLIISVLLSMVGLGGGALYVPLLLALGYQFQDASTLSLFLITVTGISAFSRYGKAKLVDWRLAFVMEIFTDIGAFAGGITSGNFHDAHLRILLGAVLLATAFFMVKMQNRTNSDSPVKTGFGYWKRNFAGETYSVSIPIIIPTTLAVGYLAGLLGIAGGVLKVPIMILWFGVPAKIAVATSSLMVGLTGLIGLLGHLFNSALDWSLALGLGVVVFVGGQIGSRFSIELPEKKVKMLIAAVFVLLAVWMIVHSVLLSAN